MYVARVLVVVPLLLSLSRQQGMCKLDTLHRGTFVQYCAVIRFRFRIRIPELRFRCLVRSRISMNQQ